jgi:hypothetical protein
MYIFNKFLSLEKEDQKVVTSEQKKKSLFSQENDKNKTSDRLLPKKVYKS